LRQSSNADDFIFNRTRIVSYVSRHFTLKPGDILFTRTPEGVIMGNPKEKQVWLKAGDQIECSVEKLGVLRVDLIESPREECTSQSAGLRPVFWTMTPGSCIVGESLV
jgi:2-keto-4-pentenoate hydratase/2-oxohepta-3-ene-1,7-dioic acid hydratase in catechol pathway